MPNAISNTSPLLYLYRIGAINWLAKLFEEIWAPEAVQDELLAGRSRGYDVPDPADCNWLKIVNPKSMPSEWLALDLGKGEIAARKLDQIDSVTTLSELRIPPNNRLEALSGDRKGQHSIRINDQYRICFVWTESGPDQVEIVDYH
jgi:plasmid maintenance system killer protein